MFLLFTIIYFLSTLAQRYSRVEIDLKKTSLEKISSLGIPIEGKVKKYSTFITEISQYELEILEKNQIPYKILIEDVEQFYKERNVKQQVEEEKTTTCYPSIHYLTPNNFNQGSMGGFLTYQEILNELDTMNVLYPNIISVRQPIDTFYTHNNNQIYYVKISDNPNVNEAEPKILYISLVHAREPMGMQQMIFFMWYILENYSINPEIQYLVDNIELYFVPCVNPDGYEYNRQNNPAGGGMWRKNRRNNSDGSFGVDLNRNFGYMWGFDDIGSSPIPHMETYRGLSPFSEPETQAIKHLCETIQPLFILDYHTFSDILLYPWGYINQETPDSIIYNNYSKYLTVENFFPYGLPFGLIGYNANGNSMDWYYGEQITKNKIISWIPELGSIDDGFWPQTSNIEYLAKQCMGMNLQVARFALNYATLQDITPQWITSLQNKFVYNLTRIGVVDSQQFTVYFEPLTNNIINYGLPKYYILQQFQSVIDSIYFLLDPSIMEGDTIIFVIHMNNSQITLSDTITKIYGTPVSIFFSDCSNLTGWTGNWFITTYSYYSSPASITDSPFGNYQNNANYKIISPSINLSNAYAARLRFWCKWDIEKNYDYAQLSISNDNGQSWIPLCGKYTKPGKVSQDYMNPIYDGIQLQWVQEYIDLTNWLGQTVKFQFQIKSDGFVNADGFYFDDFNVEIIQQQQTTFNNNVYTHLNVYPNPANSILKLSISNTCQYIQIIDMRGKIILETIPTSNYIAFDISHLPAGIYIVKAKSYDQFMYQRFIKLSD